MSRSPVRSAAHTRGFTLVELLIVLGIILVLVGLFLTSGKNAREQANRAACANAMRQAAMGLLAYAQDNDGRFPVAAVAGVPVPEDWVYWQNVPYREIEKSPILKYLRGQAANALRCPSDDTSARRTNPPYPYSFVMNQLFSGSYEVNGAKVRLQAVVEPSRKILMIEEDERSINDGAWDPDSFGSAQEGAIATRHDNRREGWESFRGRPGLQRPDRTDQGNAAFADGHVDFVSRADTWQKMYFDPRKAHPKDTSR
jgi:prepilin-type N-terminal cleavage/methylation domain-containing protein/prepilin-type processing-associated H-X9-DG protein